MLTADLAIERALNDHGQMPDMVAGHSLGEYAALDVCRNLRHGRRSTCFRSSRY